MERLTTDTPKDNFEMALNLFYVKDKEVWVRGYGKNGADISLFDLSRDLTRWNCPYVDLDISDDSFSMMMAEWLWEDVESFEHVLALLYQAAWVCAELREHLKQYEDTGLSPIACEESAKIEKGLSEGGYSPSRMVELMCADKEGRVIVLPCKVGDTVYTIVQVFGDDGVRPRIIEKKITGIGGNALNKVWMVNKGNKYEDRFSPSEFGRSVFLTREEAEKALREME